MTEAERLAQALVERVREVAPDDEDFLTSMRTSFLERYPGQEATWEAADRGHRPPDRRGRGE